MQKIKFILLIVICISFITNSSFSEDNNKDKVEKNTELSMYSGMFDFSDEGKKSILLGFEHQNDQLFRDTFLGILSPISGGFITGDNAIYLYTGIQANYDIGAFKFTPSFTPGIYSTGDGKDLGHPLEFKSELQLSLDLPNSTMLGMSYNHISNASLGNKNPGANSYMFNLLKNF